MKDTDRLHELRELVAAAKRIADELEHPCWGLLAEAETEIDDELGRLG